MTDLELLLSRRLPDGLFRHVQRVRESAVVLAQRFGADPAQAAPAGLLHDYCRHLPADELLALARRCGCLRHPVEERQPLLLHGPVAACLLPSEVGVRDAAVLQAIARHTTGAAEMSLLDQVIWLADYIEPARNFPGLESVRFLGEKHLSRAVLLGLRQMGEYVTRMGWEPHPDALAAQAWLARELGEEG